MKKYLILFAAILLISCARNNTQSNNVNNIKDDPHSFSEPHKIILKSLNLKLKVDFPNQTLEGIAQWSIENLSGADELILDTRDLEISKITLDDNETEVFFILGNEDQYLGQPLSIQIKPNTKQVNIYYKTKQDAAALQWLSPEQTTDKNYPFLYTQSQAILARSWIPCQDSPSIKFTYNAEIEVPKELLALMSAENPQGKNIFGKYQFKQTNPIPSYQMALAVGDIVFKKTSEITGIYAEPSLLKSASREFSDLGKMVTEGEKIFGKYHWGRFDVLVLPPSFPYGSTENPFLTYTTSTAISGDKSFVSLIAHELAHSWSGSLVTNSTWNNIWLNEGIAVYFERRIIESIYGAKEAKMLEVLGYKELIYTLNKLGVKNADTRLNADFKDRNPEENNTDIPYEKGYFFLKNIEEAIGRQKFDEFLKSYFIKYAFKSINLNKFELELNNLTVNNDALKKKINAKEWIYQPGLPANFKAPLSKNFSRIDDIQKKLSINNIKGLKNTISTSLERIYFIITLPQKTNGVFLAAIDKEFNFTNSNNAEIQCAWFNLAVKNNYKAAFPKMEDFLINVGRLRFIEPIYTELLKSKEGNQLAIAIYKKARPNYLAVSYGILDEMINP